MPAEHAFANSNVPPEYSALLDRVEACLNEQGPYISMVNPETGTDWESRVRVLDTQNKQDGTEELHGSFILLSPNQTEPQAGLDIGLGYTIAVHYPGEQRVYDCQPTAGYVRRSGVAGNRPLTAAQYENMLFLLNHSRPATLAEVGEISRAMSEVGLQTRTKGMHAAKLIIGLANGEAVVV